MVARDQVCPVPPWRPQEADQPQPAIVPILVLPMKEANFITLCTILKPLTIPCFR